jgi:hypothetical protein
MLLIPGRLSDFVIISPHNRNVGIAGIPRLGFALCLPLLVGYVVDIMTVSGFDSRSSGLFSGKHLLRFASAAELTRGL